MQRLPYPHSLLPTEAIRFTLSNNILPMGQLTNSGNTGISGPKLVSQAGVPTLGVPGGPKHVNPENIAANLGARLIPLYPNVRLKHLPFYDVISEIQKPTTLLARVKTYFKFNLTPKQAQDIAMSREIHPDNKTEYRVQVQLRFCYIDHASDQADKLPPQLIVTVNGTHAHLPDFLPCRRGAEPKRPDLPIDITPLCRMSATMTNHIEISWGFEVGRAYCVTVKLVKKLSSDILLNRLSLFGNRNPNQTRAFIKEKLKHDGDSEIATTSLRVSLLCPVGKSRMKIPCRSRVCTHLQCFDAKTFLMMNEKKARWMCPVCDKPTQFLDLYIDGLFQQILEDAYEDEIEFSEDGSWRAVKEEEEGNNKEQSSGMYGAPVISSNDKPNNEELIDLISDDEDSPPLPSLSCEKSQPVDLLTQPEQQAANARDEAVLPAYLNHIATSRFPQTVRLLSAAGLLPQTCDISQDTSVVSQPQPAQSGTTKEAIHPAVAQSGDIPALVDAVPQSRANSRPPSSLSGRSSRSSQSYNSESEGRYTTGEEAVRSSTSSTASCSPRLNSSLSRDESFSGLDLRKDSEKAEAKRTSHQTSATNNSSSGSEKTVSQNKKTIDRKDSTDSDDSLNFVKIARKRKANLIQSDSETEQCKQTTKSKSKHKRRRKDSFYNTRESGKDSDSDTDIYIPINHRNRKNVIESDDSSSDSDMPLLQRQLSLKEKRKRKDSATVDKSNFRNIDSASLNKISNVDTAKNSVSVEKQQRTNKLKLKPVVKLIDITKCKNYKNILKTKSVKINSVQSDTSKTVDTEFVCDIKIPEILSTDQKHLSGDEKEPETEAFNDLSETVEYGTDSSEDSFILDFIDESSSSSSGSDWEAERRRKAGSKTKVKNKGRGKRKRKVNKLVSNFREAREQWLKKKAKSLKN